jgi:hypothetical protein
MPALELPTLQQKLLAIGRNGSGKTQGLAWALSRARFDQQPFIILNYKNDELLDAIPYVEQIGFDKIPDHPGVFMITPTPDDDDDHVEAWLRMVWTHQHVGLVLDEGFEIPRGSRAFNSVLKQGRSRFIPLLIANQRPVELNRSVFSESDKIMLFHLSDQRDIKTVAEFVPADIIPDNIPKYCSVWVDRNANTVLRLNPVPSAEAILAVFEDRLRPRHNHTWLA